MIVQPTTDREYLRRWMLRPAFLRMMGARHDAKIVQAFETAMASDAIYFSVTDEQREYGCIIFNREAFGWSLHLCLATWWRKTRVAVNEAVRQMRGTILARYPVERRSVEHLLDDVGFAPGYVADGWRVRTLTTT